MESPRHAVSVPAARRIEKEIFMMDALLREISCGMRLPPTRDSSERSAGR
jgi:hypothetical protein